MAKKTAPLLPTFTELLVQFGERLRTARLRRKLSARQVAERAGMAPMTLRSVERGGAGVTIGAYLAVMQVLGIERDLDLLGKADPLGRELQDARLPARVVHARVSSPSSTEPDATPGKRALRTKGETGGSASPEPDVPVKRARKRSTSTSTSTSTSARATGDWIQQGAFSSADALASLIDPPAVPKPRRR